MRGASSWCIAIATPPMCVPVMGWSGFAFGFRIAADVIILYSFSAYSEFLGMCVSCIISMCIFL